MAIAKIRDYSQSIRIEAIDIKRQRYALDKVHHIIT